MEMCETKIEWARKVGGKEVRIGGEWDSESEDD
jgi:hypothetical protein